MGAFLEFQISISQLFQEIQGSNLEYKLITPKPITGTYFNTNLSRFGLASLPIAAILEFWMFISQSFEELQGWHLEFKLITPKSITGTNFWIWQPTWNFQETISHLFEELQS